MTKPAYIWALLLPLLCCPISVSMAAESAQSPWQSSDGVVVIVGSPYIELYVQPGRSHARFHAVEKNERLRLFKSRAGWYQVETQDGKTGWVPEHALHTVYDAQGYALDLSTPQWHEARNPWQLGLVAGTFGGTEAYTVFTGYRFTPNLSAELRYGQAFGVSTRYKLSSLMFVHQLFPKWRASPFFTLGAGKMKIYRETVNALSPDENDITISTGGGLIFYLTHNVSARVEYNHHILLTTADRNQEVDQWKAGFSVLF